MAHQIIEGRNGFARDHAETQRNDMAQSSPSVLIIRLDAIGDALALGPLLAALGSANIPIDLVLRRENFDAFAPSATRASFEAPFALRSNARADLRAIDQFGEELRQRKYSHVLVATEDPGGYRLARAVGAPHRIGFDNGWGKPFKSLWVRSMLTQTLHRSAALDARAPHECEVLFALGQSLLPGAVPTRDIAELRPLVIEHDVAPDARVAVQITDKWQRLGIDIDEVAALLTDLASSMPIRVIASDRESAYADRIRHRTGIDPTLFATTPEWKAAIAAARVIVAPDSGALHVAGMTGTPTVAIFPPSKDFDLQVARWSPWAAPVRIVKADRGWVARVRDALTAQGNLRP